MTSDNDIRLLERIERIMGADAAREVARKRLARVCCPRCGRAGNAERVLCARCYRAGWRWCRYCAWISNEWHCPLCAKVLRYRRWPRRIRELAIRLYCDGAPRSEIERATGAAWNTINSWVREADIPRRRDTDTTIAQHAHCAAVRGNALAAYQRGERVRDIAAHYQIAMSTVMRWVRQAGLARRHTRGPAVAHRNYLASLRDDVTARYAAGASAKTLAAQYGVSHTAIADLINRAGLATRGRNLSPDPALRERLLTAIAEHGGVKAAAEAIGAYTGLLRRALRDAGYTEAGWLRACRYAHIRDLAAKGAALKEIAAMLDLPYSTVWEIVRGPVKRSHKQKRHASD